MNNRVKTTNDLDLKDRLVAINRVTKVTKGGRAFTFAAIVVVGNENGIVGWGLGKANEVQAAIAKGVEDAKKNLVKIPVIKGTIPHKQEYRYGGSQVMIRPAAPGTGIIAGGAMRAVLESAKKNLIRVPVHKGTIPHEQVAKFGGSRIILKPASHGTGVKAGGAMRAVLESVGITDVLAKSKGSSNPHNLVKATIAALGEMRSPAQVAQNRGISVEQVFKG